MVKEVAVMTIEVYSHTGGLLECNECGPLGVAPDFIDAAFAHINEHNREVTNA